MFVTGTEVANGVAGCCLGRLRNIKKTATITERRPKSSDQRARTRYRWRTR